MAAAKPHIGVLCTTRALGGMELNLLRLAGWMRRRGWQATAAGLDSAAFTEHAADFGLPSLSVSPYKKYFDIAGARALAESLKRAGIEVLFFSANRDVNTAVLAKQLFYPSLKTVYLQQMQLGIAKKDMLHTWQYRRLDAWIAPLQWLAEQARAYTRVPQERIRIIPLCIETERFQDAPARKYDARQALDLPRDAFIAGTVGRFDAGKYQEVLVRAAGIVRERGEPCHILLVGEDTRDEQQNYGGTLKELAGELGVSKYVHFRHFRNDVETAYAAMDVFVMTTPAETFGMVTVEAMAAGAPVIAANGGGSPELLDFGNAGVLVPPRDDEALAEALAALRSTPERRENLSAAGRRRATERYSHTRQCEQTEELITEFFGHRGNPGT